MLLYLHFFEQLVVIHYSCGDAFGNRHQSEELRLFDAPREWEVKMDGGSAPT